MVPYRAGNSGTIGLVSGKLFRGSLRRHDIQLQPGDSLLLCTDEFSKLRILQRKNMRGSLLRRSSGCLMRVIQSIVDAIAQDVLQFADGHLDDDLTFS